MRGVNKVVALSAFTLAGVVSVNSAFAQDAVSKEEFQTAGLIHICKVRAEQSGLLDEVKLWEKIGADYISEAAYEKAVASTGAVSDVLQGVNPEILKARCNEERLAVIDPNFEATQEQLHAIELADRVVDLGVELVDELRLSGYDLSDNNILLNHFVAIGNFYGVEGKERAVDEAIYAYELAIEAVRNQRKAFRKSGAKSKNGKALLASSNYCVDVVDRHLFNKPEISDEYVSLSAVRHLLFQGLKSHRSAIGGVENTEHLALKAKLDGAAQEGVGEDGDAVNVSKVLEQTMMAPLCMRGLLKIVTDLVANPLEKAEKNVSREASK